jgi:hypothetical protein
MTDFPIDIIKSSTGNSPSPEYITNIIQNAKACYAITRVLVVHSNISPNDRQNIQDISLLDTYLSVFSAASIYPLHPKGFDLTKPDEAANFTKALANGYFRVITEALPGIVSLESSTQKSFSATVTTDDLHLELLNELFCSFGFSPTTMNQLDSLIINIVNRLGSLKEAGSEQPETLDYLFAVYYFEESQQITSVKVPKIRLFYLHIGQRYGQAPVGKSSNNSFDFNMNYGDYKFAMSFASMPAMRERIREFVTNLTQQEFASIQNLVAMDAIRTD